MKTPKTGSWVRVYWVDASTTGRWMDPDEESARTIEITAGVFRGFTADLCIIVTPTVSLRLPEKELLRALSDVQIPIGCVKRIEKLPTAVINPKPKRRKSA